MKSSVKPLYSVTGSIGADDFTAHVMLDKKNKSVHIHFYGDPFGNAKQPILVKQSIVKFPEGENIDLVKQIIIGELPGKNIHIKNIAFAAGPPIDESRHPQRTIIRFKK